MSDETSTAVLDAPVTTGSESSSNTPAPSTPGAPSSSTTAPAGVTPEAVATPAEFKAPARNAGEGVAAYLKRTREARDTFEKTGKAAEPAKPAVEVKPAATVEAPKPTEAAKPTEPAKTEEVPDPTKEDELIPDAGLATTELAEKVKNDPELAAALEKSGLRNALFANARLADKANQFIKEFPGGFDEVKFTKQYAAEREALEGGFTTVGTPQEVGQFFTDVVMPMSYVLDENGQPVPDGRGSFVTDGSVDRFIDNTVNLGLQLFPAQVFKNLLTLPNGKEAVLKEISSLAAEGDDEMKAALEILEDRLGKRSSSSPAREPQSEQEKQLAAERAAVNAEKERLTQQRQTEAQQRDTDNERAVATSISSEANKLIDQVLGKFAISEFNKESAKEKIRNALYDRINEDQTFKMQAAQLARKQYGAKSHQERVGLALRTAKSYLWSVAQPIIKAAGGELVAQNQAKHQKIATQIDASKKEPKAGLTTPSGSAAPLTAAEVTAKARENLKAQGKDPSSTAAVIAEVRRIRAGQ